MNSRYDEALEPISQTYLDALLLHGIDYTRWTPERGYYACQCGFQGVHHESRDLHQELARRIAGDEHDQACREAMRAVDTQTTE